MKKYIIKTLFFYVLSLSCACAQNKHQNNEKELKNKYIEVKNATINNKLEIANFSDCKFSEPNGMYLMNSDKVIYQDCNQLFEFKPDMATFRLIKHFGNAFAADKNGIYYRGQIVVNDTIGFKIVGEQDRPRGRAGSYQGEDYLWRTNKQAFFGTEKIDVSDPATFNAQKNFNGNDFQDKKFNYYIDFESNEQIFEKYPKEDGNFLYVKGKKMYYEGEAVQRVNDILYKTSKYVLVSKGYHIEKGLEKAKGDFDVATLKGLTNSYAIDKNHVYYGISPVPIPTERLPFVRVFDQINSRYVTDGKVIYQNDSILRKGLDAATFGMFPDSDFYYDKNGVYDREYDEILKNLVNIKMPFIYKEPVSTKNTFYVNYYFIYGNQAVYPWEGDKSQHFKNLTPEQVASLKKGEISLVNINNKAFEKEEFDYKLYKANGKIYWNGQLTSADAATFQSEGYLFKKDKNNVYFYDREEGLFIVKGLDPKTFRATYNGFYDDGEYLYFENTRMIKSKDWELLAVFAGYRLGCGMDTRPSSDYYMLRNAEGYYLAEISNEVTIRFLGKTKPKELISLEK